MLTHIPFFAGPSTTINSSAETSIAESSECREEAFHHPVNSPGTNNAESVSEMAIVPAMPTSTPLQTSISNTQADETAADTEVNDETGDEAQGDEDGGQSEIMVPQPPYVGQRFDSFTEAKEFYQTYAKFHGFAVNTEYHRKIKKTNEYSRGEMMRTSLLLLHLPQLLHQLFHLVLLLERGRDILMAPE